MNHTPCVHGELVTRGVDVLLQEANGPIKINMFL